MAESDKISISLVVFLDMLGVKARLKSMETDEDFDKIYEDLYYIKNEFAKKSDKHLERYNQSMGKTVQVFSDSVVVSLSLESRAAGTRGTFDPFMAELHYFGLCQMSCVCYGIFLRGGIAIGKWYYENDILISPALLEAYDLERSVTVFPVLTISKDAFDFFRKHPDRESYSRDIDPINLMFRKYKAADGKFYYCLDYLGIGYDGANEWYTNEDLEKYLAERNGEKKHAILRKSYMKNQKYYLLGHKKAILKALTESKSQKIIDKYLWLAKYHNNFFKQIEPYFAEAKIKNSEIRQCLQDS